jgi:phage minor structural protein
LLYLLNKDVKTVRWNGEPLHEATSAIVKETMNGDFTLTVKYPISDSGIYQLIQEDMLIKAPTPVLGAQLFRIKKPVEHNDHLEITAYHISDDVMQRSITPVSVTSQSCGMALSRMVQNTKTALGDFSFNSDIQDRRTFNTTETETLYSVLLDGKHSIVGTWEGELVRDNFALTVKKSRGENRGVVITTHKNLKDYQRTKNSQNVVTRIHAKSTFKPEGAEKETTIRVTVDSPLINSYPYINEKEYENNNAKSAEEFQKWVQAKFSNEGIDKVSDAIKIEAYELDGQVVHMGDTVNLKSRKHNVDSFKKAIAYEFDALKEEYISLTFDDKAGTGGSRASGGLSSAADAILGVTESAQEVALEKALQNANLDFVHTAGLLRQEISDGIELAKARAEEVKRELSDTIDQRFNSFNNGPLQEAKRRAEEALRNAGSSHLLAQEAKRISEQATADITKLKNEVVDGYVGKNTYREGIRGIERRIEEVKTSTDGQIATQIAQYKQTVDGQFANITSQIAGKASQTDFQRVKETSQLYERIIGRSESDIADKVARMALTNQLFQVEVSKYASQGGPNLIKNSGNPQDSKNWGYWEIGQNPVIRVGTHDFFFKNKRNLFYVNNKTRDTVPASTIRFYLKRNTSYTVSLTAFNTWNMRGATIYFLGRKSGENQTFTRVVTLADNVKFSSDEAVRKTYTFNSEECDEGFIRIDNNGTTDSDVAILLFGDVDVYEGTSTRPWQPSPEDDNEAVRSVQSQLAGSWAVQNLTSAGSIVSQINATNNQILIEAEKIRLKGKTLLDELTAIQGYFKRLFVGEGAFAKLNAEIIGSKTITADKLIMDQAMARMFVSSDIFTDTLAAKEAFINKLRSVVVSATLLEGYKGRIGGFQIGTHDKDPNTYWLTGQNQFYVGMSNGAGNWGKTALWVNWGTTWEAPGNYAWFVKESGEMYCYNRAYFWNTPVINGDLRVTGDIYYNNENSGKSGYWIYSPQYKQILSENGYMYFVWSGGGSDWIPLNKEISDRRYKTNIEASTVSGLDVIEQLKTYSYRKEYDGKIEDISCGIMAQDVQKYIPEAFYENPDGAYSYRTFELVPYLIKAIQELNQKIEKLEKTA